MRLGTDLGGQLGIDQLLERSLQQLPKQPTNPITTEFFNQFQQAGIMALGHRASPLELAATNSLRVTRWPYRVTDPRPLVAPLDGTQTFGEDVHADNGRAKAPRDDELHALRGVVDDLQRQSEAAPGGCHRT
jgi:hypothetical protein